MPKRHSGKISNHFVLCPAGATFAFSWRKIQKFKKILDDITENVIHCNTEGADMTNSAVINFRSNPQSKIRVERLAKMTKRPASFYYNFLLDEYLDDLEDIFLAEEVIKNIRSGKEKTYTLAEVEAELGL